MPLKGPYWPANGQLTGSRRRRFRRLRCDPAACCRPLKVEESKEALRCEAPVTLLGRRAPPEGAAAGPADLLAGDELEAARCLRPVEAGIGPRLLVPGAELAVAHDVGAFEHAVVHANRVAPLLLHPAA